MKSFLVDRIVNPDRTLQNCEITVDEGVVRTVEPEAPDTGHRYPIAVPGFIDIHTHGGAGHDIMDGNSDRFLQIARYHLANGTTSFLGSTTTSPPAELDRVLKAARPAMQANTVCAARGEEASLLGIHVEGPWISPARAGAQNPSYMHAPDNEAMAIVANKHRGIYAVVADTVLAAERGKIVNNANVLTMGGWMTTPFVGIEIAQAWLEVEFTENCDPCLWVLQTTAYETGAVRIRCQF